MLKSGCKVPEVKKPPSAAFAILDRAGLEAASWECYRTAKTEYEALLP